jgi:hypothetical protein
VEPVSWEAKYPMGEIHMYPGALIGNVDTYNA